MGDFKDTFGDSPSKTVKHIDTLISFLGAASTVAEVVVPGAELVLNAMGCAERG